MNRFGFSISPSSAINLDNADLSTYNKLVKIEPDISKCMACGSCAAVCTASQYTSLNFRKMILMLSRGDEKEVLKEIKSCMLCGKCLIVCPRGINTRHIILTICKLYNLE